MRQEPKKQKKLVVIISTGFEHHFFTAQCLASPPKAANLLTNRFSDIDGQLVDLRNWRLV
jgi:hypothetical protein